MLSNGDKCNKKKGLQALSDSRASETIKSINVDRCVRIGHSALLAMAQMRNIETLTLSNCPNLTTEGMAAIAKSCSMLQYICLNESGRCVTVDMVVALNPLFQTLRHIDLSGCNIGRSALAQLTYYKQLNHLNLSGCNGVDDDSILVFCEGEFNPGIRHLYLDKCAKVTNLSLTWISDGLKYKVKRESSEVTLETLSFKDTK